METEKTRLLVAAEAQRVAQMEAETQKKVAAIQIEQSIQVLKTQKFTTFFLY